MLHIGIVIVHGLLGLRVLIYASAVVVETVNVVLAVAMNVCPSTTTGGPMNRWIDMYASAIQAFCHKGEDAAILQAHVLLICAK